ncbi:SAM-dependent methyltransferase [hydrothermal vent metagenome]|uniref:SAM-dependent methyltransferase n=1 Tax=hydrothermal vent metagenome TaxID=652676 RepID=A0A1W1BBU4_9ZZZZ
MQKSFDDALHKPTPSADGSYTAYSKEYGEHYHSTKDGALNESLKKHIIPAFKHSQNRKEVRILDICFGLGFNTLATILYYRKYAPQTKLYIYSPELDKKLIKSLKNFSYPKEFDPLKVIIEALSTNGLYSDQTLTIELFLGDAREYVKNFHNFFDIIYQDAFSPSANPLLWTKEYFSDIAKAIKKDGILTTYSIALQTRLALYENGFFIYLAKEEGVRDFTLASLRPLKNAKEIDMEHKIKCNPNIRPLSDMKLL